ncbi:DUF2782 domain-containing protein [Pseudolysobacter antarcticus]|nr:DUF2782 domain-containing protein [Pseudolysobacter antarcticus]
MTRILFFAIVFLFSSAVIAQDSATDPAAPKPVFAPAQPPPDMDAPGTAPASAAATTSRSGNTAAAGKPAAVNVPTPASAPARVQASTSKIGDGPVAGGMPELPVVTVRKEGNDTVEEYRRNGKIFMVRIMPTDGPSHYYVDRTGNGRLDRDPLDNTPGPISPVYFKIYDWK